MYGSKSRLIFTLGLFVGSSVVASADTGNMTGKVCWHGDIEFLSTTDQDRAWVWTIDWTFTSEDGDISSAASGRCFGSGGMIDGKVDINHEYCIHNRNDGAKHMSRGKGGPKGSESIMFGGTGKFAGVTGGWTGGERMSLPASDGSIAGCRDLQGEYTLTN